MDLRDLDKGQGSIEKEAGMVMNLDRMIHEPSRLAILTILRRDTRADYLSIQGLTALSKGNLSNHLAKLEGAGLVSVDKHFEGKQPVTTVELTGRGREAIEGYWASIENIAAGSRRRCRKHPEEGAREQE